jgi:hypothetical protein
MVILAYHIKGELSGIFGIKVTITFRDWKCSSMIECVLKVQVLNMWETLVSLLSTKKIIKTPISYIVFMNSISDCSSIKMRRSRA